MTPSPYISDRFEQLLANKTALAPWDTVIFENAYVVVAPTLGSTTSLWVLLVPKHKCLNYGEMSQHLTINPHNLLTDVVEQLGYSDRRWIWFEHGAASTGSEVGCGVDYAHLHLILDPSFTFSEFTIAAQQETLAKSNQWTSMSASSAYDDLDPADSYYVFGDATSAFRLEGKSLGSQYFRRVVAKLVGKPEQWDYREHPGKKNVVKTLEQLHLIANAAE